MVSFSIANPSASDEADALSKQADKSKLILNTNDRSFLMFFISKAVLSYLLKAKPI